jgi:hypothetical protein
MPMLPMHGTAPPLFVGRDEKTVPFLRWVRSVTVLESCLPECLH